MTQMIKFFILISLIVNNLASSQINDTQQEHFAHKIFSFKNNVNNRDLNESKSIDSSFHPSLIVVNVTEFVIRVRGGLDKAKDIANKFNLKLVKKVFEKSNYYLFQQEINSVKKFRNEDYEYNSDDFDSDNLIISKKSKRNSKKIKRLRRAQDKDEINLLKSDPNIEWVQQQIPKKRIKRDFIDFDTKFISKTIRKRDSDHLINSDEKLKFNDPMWTKLWYINPQEKNPNSMRIKEAWQLGYTGKGVVVTILDDGLEWDHPDIIKNYDPKASLDINDNDNDPRPRYDRYNYNKHGTRCAGEIAAVADNKVCSVGVAHSSKIGGIRMLDGEVTDLVEATALSYNRDYIDIYSASWGPDDDGKTVDGPGFLALKAIEDGIKYGRRGLGSIYVWASGNGGKDDDNCNCDGYTNSIYTISISSATQNGNIPWYSESCSSTIASTFSSGSYEERQIITTDLRKSCTEAHTGTSASAPLAAGIIALTLEANPELSWRDVQHIIVETSKPDNLSSTDWQLNGAYRKVSHSFGYGMMDALAMVQLAKKWTNVPSQRKCVIESSTNGLQKPILIPKGDRLIIELYSTGCKGTKNEINYLEHVQAVISVQSNSRGTLVVYLKSPMGTNSTLLDRRMLDQSPESFNKWPFTSVHMWGEVPHGTWIIEIKNNAKNTTYLNLNLILYGTKDSPQKRSTDKVQEETLKNTNQESSIQLMDNLSKTSAFPDHKNRKALKTDLQQQSFNSSKTKSKNTKPHKKIQKTTTTLTTTTTSTTTTTTSIATTTNQDKQFMNRLFENDDEQNFDDEEYDEASLNLNRDYLSEMMKENKKIQNHLDEDEEEVEEFDEELDDNSLDNGKINKNQMYKSDRIIPTNERSPFITYEYSANLVKSKSSQLKSKFSFFMNVLLAYYIYYNCSFLLNFF